MAEMWLHEGVCRQRTELWPVFGYVKLYVDTELNCVRDVVT
jgi:hypothetical protein